MELFGTRLKDKDLLDIVVLLKQIQKTRNEVARDSIVQMNSGFDPAGKGKEGLRRLQTNVMNISWYRTSDIRARLEEAVKKLNQGIRFS